LFGVAGVVVVGLGGGGWVAVVGGRWLGGGGWVAVVGWRWLGGGAWPVMGVARCGCGAEAEFVVSDPMLMDKSGPVGSHDLVLDTRTPPRLLCSKLLEL